jgi:hypothetical protein
MTKKSGSRSTHLDEALLEEDLHHLLQDRQQARVVYAYVRGMLKIL